MLIALFPPTLPASTGDQLPVLTHAHDVQILSVAEAKREYPVKLRGVVTYADRISDTLADMFIQDETAGIFVFLMASKTSAPIHMGQIVEVDGITTPGDFSPCVTKARITVLSEGALPKPKHFPFDELLGAKEDGQWTEQEGVVRSGQLKTGRLFLNVATVGGTFLAIMPDYPKDWQKYIDAKVGLTGVLAPIFNDRRQSVGFRLFLPGPAFVRVEEPSVADPFSLPAVPTVTVAQFRPQGYFEHRIRVRATVTAVDPGLAIYIADSQGNLQVHSVPFCAVRPGDLVDVVGFPGSVDSRPGLQDSICRPAQGKPEEHAVLVNADEILPAQIDSDPSGYGLRAGKKYDTRLVSIEGKVLQASQGPEGRMMVLAAGKRTFTAALPASAQGNAPTLDAGSRVLLTGVCIVTYDQYRRGQYFRILLRRPGDIVIREQAPWLNLRFAIWGFCLTVVFFVAALVWVLVLRGQVMQRTEELRRLSLLDPLTGAANRRQFDETLAAEFQRARRIASPLSLLMVDIDYFKSLNDSAGHQAGDSCLVQVVRGLQSVVSRSSDLVARYGGEEFAVILPGTDRAGACRVAEAIRAEVEKLAIAHPGQPGKTVLSVSVGIAALYQRSEETCSSLVERADRALYHAKQTGRNRVVSWEETVAGDLTAVRMINPVCA